jgi:hypothetical protein
MSAVLFAALGCSGKMIQKLESENQSLKSSADSLQQQARLLAQVTAENRILKNKVDSLEHVAMALRDAPEDRYREAIDLLASERYDEAKTEFESLALKYPASPLAVSAREQLAQLPRMLAKVAAIRRAEEKQRQAEEKERQTEENRLQQQEEAKYKPLPHDAANEQWRRFRNGLEQKGTVTTWEFKVSVMSRGNLFGWLHVDTHYGKLEYPVVVQGDGYSSYATLASSGKFPAVREDDWIAVTGEFCRVSEDGEVVLTPVRVTNEGYRE